MRHIPTALRRLVHERAGGACEYCLYPESLAFTAHEIDHIVAQKHGGETTEANLALSCALCNKYKGSDLASFDPETGELAAVFHPRRQRWRDHFQIAGSSIAGLTPVARATVRLLQLNHPSRLAERAILIAAGLISVPDR
ncbi:HNH endonuclease signature motif containing protein [Sorangium sp. So ce119]|uniref:HNH endonuclease n=1 Tax=Sorangium sp. So ce119 TaxID=3133279 RepID=UPI003F643B42